MNYWFIKSEPFKYPYSQLEAEGQTFWDGVRNYQARNYLKDMRVGDLALFYHSNEGKEVVGIAQIVNEAYQDPTTDETAWVVVDVAPYKRLPNPVSLQALRDEPRLSNLPIFKQMRLSVAPVTREEFDLIVAMGQ